MRFRSLISLLFLLFFTSSAYARFVSLHPSSTSLISDGIDGGSNLDGGSGSVIKTVVSAPAEEKEEACEQTYGFMPCTKTALGNVFLILVYGFLMFTAATYLSAGSELLLEILGPGIVGGLFLPMLGALPDAMLIMGMSKCLFFSNLDHPDFVSFDSMFHMEKNAILFCFDEEDSKELCDSFEF